MKSVRSSLLLSLVIAFLFSSSAFAYNTPVAGPAGGDLSGTYPNPTVARSNGTAFGTAAFQPSSAFDASGAAAAAQAASDPSGAAATVKAYFTALTGILSCNGTGCTASSTIPATSITGLAASATTDTTNAVNITSGTLPAARVPGLTGDVTKAAGSAATTVTAINGGTVPASAPLLTTNASGQPVALSTVPLANGGTGSKTPFFNVKDSTCGALGNGITKSDFTFTASSASVTSASYTFTSADVGKLIAVYDGTSVSVTVNTTAGSNVVTALSSQTGILGTQSVIGSGIPAGTQVVTILSPTTMQLSQEATTTATGVTLTLLPAKSSTITSVSGGVATISNAATTSISGIGLGSFGTNDQPAIQQCITNASAAGGGTLYLPTGMYIINNNLSFANEVSMRGEGAGKSLIKWISTANQLNGMIFRPNPPSTCTSVEAGAFSDNNFSYFELDGSAATLGAYTNTAKGFGFPCTKRSTIDHVYVHDTPATCLATDTGFPTQVSNNIVSGCGRLSVAGNGSNGIGEGTYSGYPDEAYVITGNVVVNVHNYSILIENESSGVISTAAVTISGNYIQVPPVTNSGSSSGISAETYGAVVTGNYVNDYYENAGGFVQGFGIAVDAGTTNQAAPVQTVVSGNSVFGFKYGILINDTFGTTSSNLPMKTIVSNNQFYGAGFYGAYLVGNSSVVADDILFSGNVISHASRSGIGVTGAGGWKNLVFNGNVIEANGQQATSGVIYQSGIYIGSNVAGLEMSGNLITDDGTGTQKWALSVDSGFAVTNANVTGNNLVGNATSAFDMLGTLTGLLSNNLGAPTFTISGACASTSPVGQGDVGSYLSGTAGTCTTTILPYSTANIIAPNGWSCVANDLTTTTDLIGQSASTTTGCTLAGTTASGDKIVFQARAF